MSNNRLVELKKNFTRHEPDERRPIHTMHDVTGGITQIDDIYCDHNRIRSMCQACKDLPAETKSLNQIRIEKL